MWYKDTLKYNTKTKRGGKISHPSQKQKTQN